ncbi:MAG: cytochrome c3 family protein [bacterium]
MESREERIIIGSMEKGYWRQFSHGLSLLAGVFLLVVSRGFLLANPLLGSGILILFSLLSLAFARLLAKVFMYPAVILLTFSYFLFAYWLVPSFPLLSPVLSIPLVIFLSGTRYALEKAKVPLALGHKEALRVLDDTASMMSFFFVITVLMQNRDYLTKKPAVAGCTLAFYSLFSFWRFFRQPKKSSCLPTLWLYYGLVCLPLSLFFLLYQIPAIPLESHGLYLSILFMIFMYAGVCRQMQTKEKRWHPASVVGSAGLLIALWYCRTNISLLMVVQFLYSFHFYRLYTLQKHISGFPLSSSGCLLPSSGLPSPPSGCPATVSDCLVPSSGCLATTGAAIQKTGVINRERQPDQEDFLLLSYLPTLVYLLLFAWNGFPVNFFCLGISLAYALLYFAAAWNNGPEDKGERNICAYMFGLFMNIAFFEGLLIHSPVYEISWYLILAIPLIWVFFWLGYIGQQQGLCAFSKSIYEVQFLTVLFSFLIPLQLANYSLDFICMLAFGYLFSMLLFFLITEDKKFLFPVVLVAAFLYFYLIPKDFLSYEGGNLLFLLPSFLLLGQGIWSQRKGYSLSEIWYFGWMVLSGFFLVTLHYSSALCIYGLSVCTFLYCLAYGCLAGSSPRLSRASYWIANALSLVAVIVWAYTRNLSSGIFLGLILSACHLFMAYRTRKVLHIYAACLSLAAVWYGGLLAGAHWKVLLPGALPLALILYGCSFWPSLRWGKNAITFSGHLWIAAITLKALMNSGAGNPGWLLLPLLVYAFGYLFLSFISLCYENVFLTATFFAISYYFGLQSITTLLPAMRLQYFFLCPFFFCFAGYMVKRKKGEDQSQPVFDVATLVALTCSIMALFYGDLEVTQKLLLLSAILYMFLAVQLAKELYLYLSTITLGLLAYNFLNIDYQKYMGDLSVYGLYLISFLGLFFFLSPAAGKSVVDNTSSQKSALLKKALACLGLLASFPFILIPLYSHKIINDPDFCSRCHYMRPYTAAWKTSSHQAVSCVSCHYEHLNSPVDREGKGRIGRVFQSLAKTYSIFPHSKVTDETCLQHGCHQWEEIQEEKKFKQGIRFSHSQHLEKTPRGKHLRCITCHSQIVQGEHVRVTETTCFDCHFKGRQEKDTGIGGCITCHSLPGISISFAGVKFTHQEFMAKNENLQCTDCHIKVTQGDGLVPKERCTTCHLKPRQADDPALIHTIHVNKQMIECFRCHQDIQHGQKGVSKQASINCMACHRSDHSLPKKAYPWSEKNGFPGITDFMFPAEKACQECHS